MSRGFSGGRIMRFSILLSLPLILVCAGPVNAASQQDWDDCKQSADRDRTVSRLHACAAGSVRKRKQPRDAHRNRGTAYSGMGARERALADFDEAIKLDPKFAAAYFGRGLARSWEDLDRKIADFSETIRLDPKFVEACEHRGSRLLPTRRTTTAPSPSTARRSSSTRNAARLTSSAAHTHFTKRTTTAPSPTTTKRSGSSRATPSPTATAASCIPRQEGLRPRPRRLQRGDQARSEKRLRLQQPRPRVLRTRKDYDRAIADYSEAIKLDPK